MIFEWTWRAIFWINVPVAILALICTARAKPANEKHPAPMDYRGAVLISAGMGLAVLGLQQSSVWGWGSVVTWACIAAGVALLLAFVRYELRLEYPLMQIRTFANRAFAVDNAILFLLMKQAGTKAKEIFAAVQYDFALSSRTVFYGMAAAMAVAFIVALVWMPSGKAPDLDAREPADGPPAA